MTRRTPITSGIVIWILLAVPVGLLFWLVWAVIPVSAKSEARAARRREARQERWAAAYETEQAKIEARGSKPLSAPTGVASTLRRVLKTVMSSAFSKNVQRRGLTARAESPFTHHIQLQDDADKNSELAEDPNDSGEDAA